MDDIEKLRHLLVHWAEHNAGHANAYLEWAKKADTLGMSELSKLLIKIEEETLKLEKLFKKAGGLL